MYGVISPLEYGIKGQREAAYDVITEAHICKAIVKEFGLHYAYGSAVFGQELFTENGKTNWTLKCNEMIFRSFLKDKTINNAVEIGTKHGVGSVLLAHYAYHLTTIDIVPRTEPMAIWSHFGVLPKIDYSVVLNNDVKAKLIESLEFDFAFIDGNHSYEGIKLDFDLVKHCSRVLFHDYSCEEPVKEGCMEFFKEFPEGELIIEEPFAYWEKRK